MAAPDKRALWVGWTHDALMRYSVPEEVESQEQLIDDMIAVATEYADGMLDALDDRFRANGTEIEKGPRRKQPRKRDEEDE